jgi:hypothetical protein
MNYVAQNAEGRPITAERPLSSAADMRFGHVVSVSGSQAVAVLDLPQNPQGGNRIDIGTLVKVTTPISSVMGLVAAMSSPLPSNSVEEAEVRLVEITLAGEVYHDRESGAFHFSRGVSNSPSMGDAVCFVSREELACVYVQPDTATIEVGRLFQDDEVPACLVVDELFGKHFMVVGTTGSGKSCAVSCILRQVLEEHQFAHIVVLDIHNEYAKAFQDKAELIHPSNLRLPFWLLNFQELCTVFTGTDSHHDAEVQILSEAIVAAKRRRFESETGTVVNLLLKQPSEAKKTPERPGITVDTPCPFHLSDVVSYIDEQLGKLERLQATLPYLRLKNRVEALVSDTRYGFMFRSLTVEDTMSDVLGRIFRVPTDGKPITVIDLAAVPSEILDVVISLIARIAFDLAVWSDGKMPMLIVCEEAHRYAPAGNDDKFIPTRQALAQIAKEGRKYGISIGLVTQRPSELDTTIISQCSTVIAMRLSTDRDQQAVRANIHEGTLDILEYLPLLGDREAIILGQGAPMPMRIRFNELGPPVLPRNRNTGFSKSWRQAGIDRKTLEQVVALWRSGGAR